MSSGPSGCIMPTAQGNVGVRSVGIALVVAALVSASCQPVEQGFWARPGMSQSQFSAEYRHDSQECVSEGIERVTVDRAPEGDPILVRHLSASETGSNSYNKCMVARGYEWVTMQPLVGPAPHSQAATQAPCPADRVMVDPYGYPHCATPDQSQRARSIDGPPETDLPNSVPAAAVPTRTAPPPERPPGASDNRTPNPARSTAERRAFDESLCIQHSQRSLSNPYETYLHCMAEKGWPSSPQ